jgi:hypothetical protein
MGVSASLLDPINDGDIHQLKILLREKQSNSFMDSLQKEIEDALHVVFSMEIQSPQQIQQRQIVIELLMNACQGQALNKKETNDFKWTPFHRACVTGNLSYLPFLYANFPGAVQLANQRDLYGFYPLDLVPPELIRFENRLELKSANTKRHRDAIKCLRDSKAKAEAIGIGGNIKPNDFFIRFQLHGDTMDQSKIGQRHNLQKPLKVYYRLPQNCIHIKHGYFQLVWRGREDPRSEDLHYDVHYRICEEIIDHVDILSSKSTDFDNQKQHKKNIGPLEGVLPFDVSDLPEDAVCHVLLIASDKQMMKRTVLLSTEGILLTRSNNSIEEKGVTHGQSYIFYVAGEEFRHSSEELAGKNFEEVEEFQAFVKTLRLGTTKTYKKNNQEDHEHEMDDSDKYEKDNNS